MPNQGSDHEVVEDVKRELRRAKKILDPLIGHVRKHKGTPTAVFDLDATLITDREQPIAATLDFMAWLHKEGVYCVVVTARPSDTYEATRTLMDEGVGTAERGRWGFIRETPLYCLPLEFVGLYTSERQARAEDRPEGEDPVAMFKYMMRWMIHQTVGPLLIAMGDQAWDVQRFPSEVLGDEPNKYGIGTHESEAEFMYLKLPSAVMSRWPR